MFVPPLSNTPVYQLETISKKNDDSKFNAMKNIFDSIIIPSNGESGRRLWKKIEAGTDQTIGSRLLYADGKMVGISVYKRRKGEKLENRGLKNPYSIKALTTTNSSAKDKDMLLKMTLQLLSEQHRADAVYIKIPEEKNQDAAYFVGKGFQELPSSSKKTCTLFIKRLQTLPTSKKTVEIDSHEKRKREVEERLPENKKIRTEKFQEIKSSEIGGAPKIKPEWPGKPIPIPPPGQQEGSPFGYIASTPKRKDNVKLTSTTIKKQYLDFIKKGTKTIEGRICSGMFYNIKVGEQIQFINGNEKVICDVIGVEKYKTFKAMLETEGVGNCLPDISSLEKGVAIYNTIPGYSERAAKSGVVAIKIRVV